MIKKSYGKISEYHLVVDKWHPIFRYWNELTGWISVFTFRKVPAFYITEKKFFEKFFNEQN